MGHLTTRDAYKNLEERINWFTQGAPPSDTLYKILQVLYTEKEAKWAALLPVRPFTLKKAAKIWGTTEAKAEKLPPPLRKSAFGRLQIPWTAAICHAPSDGRVY